MQDYGTDAAGNRAPGAPWWVPDKTEAGKVAAREIGGADYFSAMSDEDFAKSRARHLVDETAVIEDRQRAHHELNLWNAMLYSNRQYANFHWGLVTGTVDQMLVPANLVTENLIHSIGDAMLASAASSPLKPTPVPLGASFKTTKLVRRLDKWVYGEWTRLRCEDSALQLFLDAFIAGTGAIRVYYDPWTKKPCVERVFFDNIIVDNFEMANAPRARTYRLRQVVPIDSVEAMYDVKLDPREAERQYTTYRLRGESWVPVIEAYRLPVGKSKGRHVVACCGQLLVDEVWEYDWIPWVFFHWERMKPGFYSPSGLELIVPYQTRLNELNEVIRDAQDLAARPRILQHAGSQIDINAWDNVVGRIMKYTGVAPQPFVWETAIGELYNERERQIDKAFQFFGRSQMTAQQELPPSVRLDSSAAVREFRLQEDTRFLDLWTRFQDARVDIARALINVMSVYGDENYETIITRGGKYVGERIRWGDVRELMKDNYSWKVEAIPLSAMAPAAQKSSLQEWVTQGVVAPDNARYLSTHPDTEMIGALERASYDDIHRVIGLLEDGKFESPDPVQNLKYGVDKVSQNALLLRQYDDDDDDVDLETVMENHYRWVRQAMALIQAATAAPVGPGAPAGSAPAQGQPGMPGSMLPNPVPMAAMNVGGALQPSALPVPGVGVPGQG